jgi:hypothetical protein
VEFKHLSGKDGPDLEDRREARIDKILFKTQPKHKKRVISTSAERSALVKNQLHGCASGAGCGGAEVKLPVQGVL